MHHLIVIVGNLGKDPEARYTPGGDMVCSFNVASNRQFTDKAGNKVKKTTWFRVAAWGKLGEIVHQHLKKGAGVYIEGRLEPDEHGNPRIWTAQDGSPRASFEVTAATVRFLPRSNGNSEGEEDHGNMVSGIDALEL